MVASVFWPMMIQLGLNKSVVCTQGFIVLPPFPPWRLHGGNGGPRRFHGSYTDLPWISMQVPWKSWIVIGVCLWRAPWRQWKQWRLHRGSMEAMEGPLSLHGGQRNEFEASYSIRSMNDHLSSVSMPSSAPVFPCCPVGHWDNS